MSDDLKCVAGCTHFYGDEKRHHEDCPFYPESRTEMYDNAVAEIAALRAQLADARKVKALVWRGTPKSREFARTPWGQYLVGTHEGRDYWAFNASGMTGYHFNFVEDRDEARASAQGDFQRRYTSISALEGV